ncbi:MAG: type II CRISPR RNA-guided endonuclease Cas9 [Ginsengibacter sp.]
MSKILGLDLGTNSIGWAIRNTLLHENQIEKFGVITFNKGVGSEKGVEYSFAAERTKNRSLRRRYEAHKYKLWATLEILITNDYCPLSIKDLNKWRKYEKGVGRRYPIDDIAFNNWIKLNFNGYGKRDYSSPYQLRLELITQKLDFSKKANRYKLGRALYHIAQHRGFKSSKKVQDKEDIKTEQDLVGAEKKRAKFIESLCIKHNTTTAGAAFAMEEKEGNRIRKNLHQHVIRKQLQDEVKQIFDFQDLSFQQLFKKDINRSAIFWQRPLRSQKGTIGKCTLEPAKYRCPVSHPAFEEFRAWSFLNTIEYKIKDDKQDDWKKISFELRQAIYQEKYFRLSVPDFDFYEIRKLIEKINGHDKWGLNYKDKTNVSACPVSARLQNIFGNDWENFKLETSEVRKLKKKDGSIQEHRINYTIEDIWHVLFSFDDEDDVRDFAEIKLGLKDKIEKFVALWYMMPVAYSMLSLKAITNILPFLKQGMIYTEAVLLAKMPEVLGEELWKQSGLNITDNIGNIIQQNREEKKMLTIANSLIAKYKSLDNTLKFAERDFDYVLKSDDKKDVEETVIEAYGNKTWNEKSDNQRNQITSEIIFLYQSFFSDKQREFKRLPHLLDTLKSFLRDNFELHEKQLGKLYHPSQIEIYPPAKEKYYEQYKGNFKLLESPKTGAFKNPMAMRALYELRKLVNYLLVTDHIDEETGIVVEVARDLNDANMRLAIETYQRRRQEENKEFANAIVELLKEYPSSKVNPDSNDDIDKFRLWFEQSNDENVNDGKNEYSKHEWANIKSKTYKAVAAATEMIEKYRLWKQQECQCIYTGYIIGIAELFSPENIVDFEHTIARSISFDNSLANLTVCDFVYNRTVKHNQLPIHLPNYDNDVLINGKKYTAIKPRLEKWEQKIEDIKVNIEYWNKKSKKAAAKEDKDKAIKQRHLWRFELDYWRNKLDRFKLTEVKSGFKNSQLVDTQIISKYAFHYLRTAFNKVRVQKGSTTSEFRKIYNVQPKDEKKDRSKHSHHAKDASVLTLIPIDAKREEILKKSYEYFERTHQQYHEPPYYGFKQVFIEEIENKILINNIQKDQSLTPGQKRVRVRGKKVLLRNKDGEILKDENGNPKEKWAKGDSIRGQLHQDTFYGAIKKVLRDADGTPVKDENEKFIFEDGLYFVVREEFIFKKTTNSPGFKNLKEIKEAVVDPHIYKAIEKQVGDSDLKDAIAEGIYMLDKNNNPIKIDKNGKNVNPIRHIRVFVRAKEPLRIKEQTNISTKPLKYLEDKSHKNYYYAGNAANILYGLYQDGKSKSFECLNIFELTEIRKHNKTKKIEDFLPASKKTGKGKVLPLYAVLKEGQKVIFHSGDMQEVKALDIQEQLKRLYRIKALFSAIDGRIQFQHHLEARPDKDLGTGSSKVDLNNLAPRYLLSPVSFNFIIERMHFEIKTDGEIKWLF